MKTRYFSKQELLDLIKELDNHVSFYDKVHGKDFSENMLYFEIKEDGQSPVLMLDSGYQDADDYRIGRI